MCPRFGSQGPLYLQLVSLQSFFICLVCPGSRPIIWADCGHLLAACSCRYPFMLRFIKTCDWSFSAWLYELEQSLDLGPKRIPPYNPPPARHSHHNSLVPPFHACTAIMFCGLRRADRKLISCFIATNSIMSPLGVQTQSHHRPALYTQHPNTRPPESGNLPLRLTSTQTRPACWQC